MSERKTDDAEVERVVRAINYISQEVTLIEMTKNWSEADFLYAMTRLDIDQPQERRDQIRGLYWSLRVERQARDARIASEETSARRHDEISRCLEGLKRPHWSIVPNFWVTVAILIFTVIGVIVAFLILRH